MPLMLVCVCGHSVPFPEEECIWTCTRCSRKSALRWYKDREWIAELRKRAFSAKDKPMPPRTWKVDMVPAPADAIAPKARSL